jgi:two-component system catabolic regulation response regulator CreB
MAQTIFLVEDEAGIAQTLIYTLESEGFEVQWFERAEPVLSALANQLPDFLILDVGLPDMNGFALWRTIQEKGYAIPMMFLTARSEEIDRILGLEMGADDYVAKPFSPREVSARVRGILRRVGQAKPISLNVGDDDFKVEDEKAQIFFRSKLLVLTRYEYLLLKTLIEQPERVFSRGLLMDLVWQDSGESMERTVDTHIKTLRAKLRNIDDSVEVVHTHRGLGYSLRITSCD